jgi:hypothetical protein
LDHGKDGFRARAILRRRLAVSRHAELDRALEADDVADRGADQAEEMPLDPVARELARDGEDECFPLELEGVHVAEPLGIRPVAERLPEPSRDLLPEVLGRQLELMFHRRPAPPRSGPAASITAPREGTK